MSLTVELPEILDDKHPIAHLINILDKDGKVLSRIKSLNTKTLQAKVYKFAGYNRIELNENNEPLTEDVQLEDITIKIK